MSAKIGWFRGEDKEWAFTYLAENIQKKLPEYSHSFNEMGDINILLAVVFTLKSPVDNKCIVHMDGNRVWNED